MWLTEEQKKLEDALRVVKAIDEFNTFIASTFQDYGSLREHEGNPDLFLRHCMEAWIFNRWDDGDEK